MTEKTEWEKIENGRNVEKSSGETYYSYRHSAHPRIKIVAQPNWLNEWFVYYTSPHRVMTIARCYGEKDAREYSQHVAMRVLPLANPLAEVRNIYTGEMKDSIFF